MNIDFDAAKPIYEQIITEIKRRIVRKELEAGDKLPSQREMARTVGVNPNTIQRAYREMEMMRLVETKRGRGTFIVDSKDNVVEIKREMAMKATENFIAEMISLGFSQGDIKEQVEGVLLNINKGVNNNEK